MKQLLVIIFLSTFYLSASQNIKIIDSIRVMGCDDGKLAAEADAKKGVYNLITYGLVVRIDDGHKFDEYYRKYLIDNYKIYLSNGGCVVSSYKNCYRKRVEELIDEKYGEDILKKAKHAAASEYKSTEDYKTNIKVRIDTGYVFSGYRLHKEPKFLKQGKEFDFIKHLGFGNFETDYFEMSKYFRLVFVIEKDGSLTNISLKNAETNDPIKNKALVKKVKNAIGWSPGMYFGEKVRTRMSYIIPLRLLK